MLFGRRTPIRAAASHRNGYRAAVFMAGTDAVAGGRRRGGGARSLSSGSRWAVLRSAGPKNSGLLVIQEAAQSGKIREVEQCFEDTGKRCFRPSCQRLILPSTVPWIPP